MAPHSSLTTTLTAHPDIVCGRIQDLLRDLSAQSTGAFLDKAAVADTAECLLALRRVLHAAYVDDCHVTGEHDPTHTPQSMCGLQLQHAAERMFTALFGVRWGMTRRRDVCRQLNKIPRRLNRRPASWFTYFHRNGPRDRVDALVRWEREGYQP